ncbi:hypothetical protein HMJ29_19585 [Hymenobacter taeanensis]|uniref:Uncharacterized protein n=1 Tax=Hymenobacter taeanensis TaxID=2735321 RepID=A0A6M6BM16_9BACT|nr:MULTISPECIES: hypothetical protein [Hymenobacter]QJX48990.1 hypothetical protein HMJ29_19585 [Hymenobacter taeanensis]UOQ81492.1 hypothetical protein MUN83_01445 [Hymenobacter sp. 5414T-23]
MESNQSANSTSSREGGNNQANNTAQPSQSSGADNQGTAAKGSSEQQPADGKNWMEYANLQKVVEQLPQGVRDFCTNSWSQMGKSLGQVGDQVNKLSTTQKVAGAVALAGIGYLALRSGKADKPSGIGSMYRGNSSKGNKKSQRGYRAGSYSSASYNSYSSPSDSTTHDSRRMDRAPGQYGELARQNASRAGGSYQSGSSNLSSSSYGSSAGSKASSDYSSTSESQKPSSMSSRGMSYRSSSSSNDELDLGAGV